MPIKVESPSPNSPMSDIKRPEEGPALEAMMSDRQYDEMDMPMGMLHNKEAFRLWARGDRLEAVEMAEETKQYLNDFILRSEDFD